MGSPPEPSPTFLALQAGLAGRYALERELGRGGMGVVYLARDISLDRPVAIKVLPPALASIPSLRDRFLREARIAARLSHPHIVPIHAVETADAFVYFVMGYVEGETLSQRIDRSGPLPPGEAARIMQEVAWALAYAHQHGVIHRDIKPENILLERGSGRALVADFGIAIVAAPGSGSGGTVAGTARYMSPEQAAGEAVDGRSDLFSLGATAFRMLTGRSPLEGAPNALVALSRGEPLPRLITVRPDLPGRLSAVVDRCLAWEPRDRFPDGESLADTLTAARGVQPAVSPVVVRFVDLYKSLTAEIAGYVSVVIVLTAQMLVARGLLIQEAILAVVLAWAFFGAVGLGVLRFAQLLRAARRLLAEGYSAADVRAALERPSSETATARPSRGIHWLRRAALLVGGAAGVVIWGVVLRWQLTFSLGWILDGLLMALFTLAPVVVVRSAIAKLLRPAKRGWWSRFWWKVLDWKVFRMAGIGRGAGSVPAADRTEVALGDGARALFHALPDDIKDRFGQIPGLLDHLEAQASRLRGPADATGGGDGRLGATLGALEQVRLDLLRLKAGAGNEGDLTGDLEAARRVAEEIDRFLAARRELSTPTAG